MTLFRSIQSRLQDVRLGGNIDGDGDGGVGAGGGGDGVKESLSKAISGKFLDWVASSGNGKALLDLVRIDAASIQNHQY